MCGSTKQASILKKLGIKVVGTVAGVAFALVVVFCARIPGWTGQPLSSPDSLHLETLLGVRQLGNTRSGPSSHTGTCAGDGPEVVYFFTPGRDGSVCATT